MVWHFTTRDTHFRPVLRVYSVVDQSAQPTDVVFSFCKSWFPNSNRNLKCLHGIAEKCWIGAKQQSLTRSLTHSLTHSLAIWNETCHDLIPMCWSYIIYESKKCFEDSKGVIRSCNSIKDRQYNGHSKKDEKTDNDPSFISTY